MKDQEGITGHWLRSARRVPSPNCDQRPGGEAPSLLVIHCISLPPGRYGSDDIERLFTNRLDRYAHPYFAGIADLRVAAHLLIRRDGTLIQFVPFDHRAWHAGRSSYRGRASCNDFSIGIELEGTDDSPFESSQYDRLDSTLRTLLETYPSLSRTHIVGHSDIAPDRKTDPGRAFDWARILPDSL